MSKIYKNIYDMIIKPRFGPKIVMNTFFLLNEKTVRKLCFDLNKKNELNFSFLIVKGRWGVHNVSKLVQNCVFLTKIVKNCCVFKLQTFKVRKTIVCIKYFEIFFFLKIWKVCLLLYNEQTKSLDSLRLKLSSFFSPRQP